MCVTRIRLFETLLIGQGTLDIMVQRSGGQESQKLTFIQNNFYHDAFFLKAQGQLYPHLPRT
jgi:hypothetical protein